MVCLGKQLAFHPSERCHHVLGVMLHRCAKHRARVSGALHKGETIRPDDRVPLQEIVTLRKGTAGGVHPGARAPRSPGAALHRSVMPFKRTVVCFRPLFRRYRRRCDPTQGQGKVFRHSPDPIPSAHRDNCTRTACKAVL